MCPVRLPADRTKEHSRAVALLDRITDGYDLPPGAGLKGALFPPLEEGRENCTGNGGHRGCELIVSKKQRLIEMIQGLGPALFALLAWDLVIVVCYQVLNWRWVGSPHVPLGSFGRSSARKFYDMNIWSERSVWKH